MKYIILMMLVMVGCTSNSDLRKIDLQRINRLSDFSDYTENDIVERIIIVSCHRNPQVVDQIKWMVSMGMFDQGKNRVYPEYVFPVVSAEKAAHLIEGLSGTAKEGRPVALFFIHDNIVNEVQIELEKMGSKVICERAAKYIIQRKSIGPDYGLGWKEGRGSE